MTNQFVKKGQSSPNQYIYQNDTFDSGSANLNFKGSAIVDSDPVGTFNTYYKSANTKYSSNLAATAPTQTINDIQTNGIMLTATAYAATSTANLPSRIDIKIGKNFKQMQILGYGSTSRSIPLTLDQQISSTAVYGGPCHVYNENTGILSLDAAQMPINSTDQQFVDATGTLRSSGYFTVSGSKSIGAFVSGSNKILNYSPAIANTLATVNQGYVALGSSSVKFTLPANSAVGDMISIVGATGGFTIYSNASAAAQKINVGSSGSSTSSSSAILLRQSSNVSDSITLICTVANSTWNAISNIGTTL